MNMQIQAHSNYDANDYDYLVAKGWTDAEILARWDREVASGKGPCLWESTTVQEKLRAVTGRN